MGSSASSPIRTRYLLIFRQYSTFNPASNLLAVPIGSALRSFVQFFRETHTSILVCSLNKSLLSDNSSLEKPNSIMCRLVMNTEQISSASLQIVRLPRVREITGLCRSTIYQLEANQKFPKRVQLGARAVGWLEHEVQGWVASRTASSRLETRRPSLPAGLPVR